MTRFDASDMPKDCLILALQAYARVKSVCEWSRIFYGKFPNRAGGGGHVLCLFESIDGSVWSYDSCGAVCLGSATNRTPANLGRLIAKAYKEPVLKPSFFSDIYTQ